VESRAGIKAAREGDANLLADGKMFKDVGHVSILSGASGVSGESEEQKDELPAASFQPLAGRQKSFVFVAIIVFLVVILIFIVAVAGFGVILHTYVDPSVALAFCGEGAFAAAVLVVAFVVGGPEFIPIVAGGYVLNGVVVVFVLGTFDELRGNLDPVEEPSGPAEVEALGAEVLDYLGECEPDGSDVLHGGKIERGIQIAGSGVGRRGGLLVMKSAMQLHMEVAIGDASHRGSIALAAAGLDVPADHVRHAWFILSMW